ncbi:hypothetical protein [Thermonema rossianum]|uniref:hypothetical protein n=1 Tax=Thermonema rossianum TaxID=55505 RepID=UPI0012F93107|nr:hypothetical protein [Thermonema rossianum]
MKEIREMIKAGFANLALLSLYRTGDQVHIQEMPPDELLTLLNKVRKQDVRFKNLYDAPVSNFIITVGTIGVFILLLPLAFIYFNPLSYKGMSAAATILVVFLCAILAIYAGWVLASAVTNLLMNLSINNTLSKYAPALMKRLHTELHRDATIDLSASVIPLYSSSRKKRFRSETYGQLPVPLQQLLDTEEKVENEGWRYYYEWSPSLQLHVTLSDNTRLCVAIHEFGREHCIVIGTGKNAERTYIYFSFFVHEVVLLPAGVPDAFNQLTGEEIEELVRKGQAVRLFELEEVESDKNTIHLEAAPSLEVTEKLLYEAYHRFHSPQNY